MIDNCAVAVMLRWQFRFDFGTIITMALSERLNKCRRGRLKSYESQYKYMKAIGKPAASVCFFFALLYCVQASAQHAFNATASVQDLAKADDLTGFVVSSDASTALTADRLYKVNLRTGESTLVGPLGPTGGVFEDVEGLALDTDGKLFGIDDDTKTLLTISAANGFATAVNNARD